ncbi:hypothetical protein [Succinatimonas hippei]|uniref:hypothetical protein n=1 Tax=Succinatimonas hippei TaxID=626938 RepID=UPI0026EBE80F|nr:hypothetical protein [Succinatimonas hippei]
MKKFSVLALAAAAAFIGSAEASFWMNASGSHNSDADLSGAPGDVSISTYNIVGGYDFVTVGYKRTDYDFSSSSSDWYDSLNYLYVDLHHNFALNDTFGVFGGLTLASGFEDDFHFDDNYSISPRAGISISFTDRITGFAGAYAQFNEVDNKYLPILGVKIGNDSEKGLSGSIAYPATRINYRFNSMLALEGTFLTIKDLYQLSDDSSKLKKGYVFEEGYGVSGGVVLTPLKGMSVRAGIQSYFDREYTYYDHGGNERSSVDVDPSVGFYANLSYGF